MVFDGVERTVVTESITVTSSYRIQGNRISFQEKTFNNDTPEELFFTNGTLTLNENDNIEVIVHDSDSEGNSDTLEYIMKKIN